MESLLVPLTKHIIVLAGHDRLAGVKDPCKSDLVITVKEGAQISTGHLTVKKEPITPKF